MLGISWCVVALADEPLESTATREPKMDVLKDCTISNNDSNKDGERETEPGGGGGFIIEYVCLALN